MKRSHKLMTVLAWLFRLINRVLPWYKLPFFNRRIPVLAALSPQVLNLPILRHDLRRWNLHDTRWGDIELVDTQVGLFAEKPPTGFGFSDTAFRIFILMASRRLKSDRFFTKDYRPEVYTPAGMDWIRENTMTSVLLRHHPRLAPALAGVANPFAPWRTVQAPALPLS